MDTIITLNKTHSTAVVLEQVLEVVNTENPGVALTFGAVASALGVDYKVDRRTYLVVFRSLQKLVSRGQIRSFSSIGAQTVFMGNGKYNNRSGVSV